jgi:hypothetical protein
VSLLQKIPSWWRHGDVDQLDPGGRAEQEKIRARGSTFKEASRVPGSKWGGWGDMHRGEKDYRPK